MEIEQAKFTLLVDKFKNMYNFENDKMLLIVLEYAATLTRIIYARRLMEENNQKEMNKCQREFL